MLERWLSEMRNRFGAEPERPAWSGWPTVGALAAGFVVGMVVMYFLDPRGGRGRRAQTAGRAAGTARKTVRKARQAGRAGAA